MEKILKNIDPQDFKNALDKLWFAAAEIESKEGKDPIAMRFVEQDRVFVKKMFDKYPFVSNLP